MGEAQKRDTTWPKLVYNSSRQGPFFPTTCFVLQVKVPKINLKRDRDCPMEEEN